MPKTPQVSIKGETFAKLKEYCNKHGIPVGKFVDKLCRDFFKEDKVCDFEQKRSKDFLKKPKA
jgi:hypothetical protein